MKASSKAGQSPTGETHGREALEEEPARSWDRAADVEVQSGTNKGAMPKEKWVKDAGTNGWHASSSHLEEPRLRLDGAKVGRGSSSLGSASIIP